MKSPKFGTQPATLPNIVVHDNRSTLDSNAGITAIKPPYISLLTTGSFPRGFLCRLVTLSA